MSERNEEFELVTKIDINLTDDEKEAIVYEWLFLTTWLNQITNKEYDTAEEVMNLFLSLWNMAHGTNFEVR